MDHLLLIDASGFAYRAFHAYPATKNSEGMPTHAILGFMSMLSRLLERANEDPFSHAATVFDAPGPTFRHKLFPKYKFGRTRPDDLKEQLPHMREASRSMGIEPIERDGFEADDVIATLATLAGIAGKRTTIVTVDKDFAQLVIDDVIELVDPVKRTRVRQKDVVAMFGVPPALVPDVQALCGDIVDNIPGVPGVGMHKAAGMIRAHGSLDELFRDMRNGDFMPTPSILAAMRRARSKIPLYRKLATLRRDVPITIDLDTLRPKRFERVHGRDILRALEAEHMFGQIFGDRHDRKPSNVVERIDDPLEWWQEELTIKRGRKDPEPMPVIPQCGFYQRRLVHLGPFVAARIWREPEIDFITEQPSGRDVLLCEVDGKRREPFDQWGYLCTAPISERDFRHMCGVTKWAREHAPTEPEANPNRPVDFMTVKPPTFGKPGRAKK